MEPEGSLPCSQKPAAQPHLELEIDYYRILPNPYLLSMFDHICVSFGNIQAVYK
jgi:hypothetical protein